MTGAMVVFRCDASAAMGAGHLARCLALADTLAAFGHRILFAMRHSTREFLAPLMRDPVDIIDVGADAEAEIDQIAARMLGRAQIMAIDHYDRDAAYESRCRSVAEKILVFDDGTRRKHDCDFLLDSAAPQPSDYANLVPEGARVLAGPSFALLRPEFAAMRAAALARRDGRPVSSLLVSVGATDPMNVTEIALDLLASLQVDLSVTVVLSSRAPALEAVRAHCHPRLRVVTDAGDMAALMTEADLAIGAAGSTAFERACLGLPTLMILVAENQRQIVDLMSARGAAIDCGAVDSGLPVRLQSGLQELMGDPLRRISMSKAASELVDGRGGQRVLAALAGVVRATDGATIGIRPAESRDESWLLELQRQPATRRFARQPDVPTELQHAAWFARTLNDPDRLLLIVEAEDERAGMVRLDRLADASASAFEISIAISEDRHGRGIGRAALTLARRIVASDLFATVLPGNSASQALFLAAGYAPHGENRYRSRLP